MSNLPDATVNDAETSVFLVILIVCALLAIFFLLYFNRIFGSVVSYAVRTWTWHRHRIYLDIRALQISLLGGRIFFTGLRYHGPNETFLIQHGYITWRYWLRRVREVDILVDNGSGEEALSERTRNDKLPCRINVNIVGLEWFVYNRSPAYDSIIAGLSDKDASSSRSTSNDEGEKDFESNIRARAAKKSNEQSLADHDESEKGRQSKYRQRTETGSANGVSSSQLADSASDIFADDSLNAKKASDLPFVLQLLPIHVDCQNAAVVIGNENTKGILIVKADSVGADIDASNAKAPDPYRQLFKVQFQHPVVEMRENEDFKEDQATRAVQERNGPLYDEIISRPSIFYRQLRSLQASLRKFRRRWFGAIDVLPSGSHAVHDDHPSRLPGSRRWQGLSRYLNDNNQDDKARWSAIEYAAEIEILDSPSATLTVYWDVVGKVSRPKNPSSKINGADPPAWAMHFSIQGGDLSYGPWTDRRRADLQRVFFPSLSKDASVAEPLPAGAWRVPTKFEISIELDETVTVKVPFREQSKNWRWRGHEPQMKQSNLPASNNRRDRQDAAKKDGKGDTAPSRPAAWLEAKIGGNSTVKYLMDMLAGPEGYSNSLEIELSSTEFRSTVNQDILWKSDSMLVSCDLSNPLEWNTLRRWHFDIEADQLELFILRDHIFLLIDLVDDWSSGPPPEYLVFTPFQYLLNLRLRNFKLNLNVNDGNIIDKPTSMDENAYLILSCPLLEAETTIPIDQFRPSKNAIPFDVRADTITLSLNAPQWNTHSAFVTANELANLQRLRLDGGYHYNATSSPANTDTLILNVFIQSPVVYLHGFVVRYFLLLKDNYFGEHVHFRTLEEYQKQLAAKERTGEDEAASPPPNKSSNDLDVILGVETSDPRFLLPKHLYSSSQYVQAELAKLSVDLRFTNYYMDLELDLSPLHLSLVGAHESLESPAAATSNTELFIDGLRVYGHRLFGLPPTEPTYLCNWDVSVGNILGECTAEFVSALVHCASVLGFAFDDVENALVPYSSLVFYDVTFARVSVESIRIWLHVGEATFLLSTGTIDVAVNDWARSHYSRRADITVPNVQIACVDADTAVKHKSRRNKPVETEAYLQTDVNISIIGRKYEFSKERQLQQELVRREDQRTRRTAFLLLPDVLGTFEAEPVDTPAQCSPIPPHPLVQVGSDRASVRSHPDSRRRHHLSRQSSFLISRTNSSTRSVRRSQNRIADVDTGTHGRGTAKDAPPGPQQPINSASIARNESPLSSRHSGLHAGAFGTSGDDTNGPSMTLSSQYLAPRFSLMDIELDTRDVPIDDDSGDEDIDEGNSLLEDLDPEGLSEEHAYTGIIISFPTGCAAVVKPSAIKHATSLLGALKPKEPEDVLDSLQIDAISEIYDTKKLRTINGSIADLLVRLPSARIRFMNSSSLDSPDPLDEEQDQYDLYVSRVHLVSRNRKDWGQGHSPEDTESKTSMNLQIGCVSVTASERLSSLQEQQAAMMVRIDRIMASVGSGDVTYADVDIGSVVGNTASGKIEYLASLIHRTGNLASEIQHLFAQTASYHEHALKHFTCRLLEEGHLINDPSFLIRPSTVLRSVPDHFRTYDSWKLAMRLRQIWRAMGPQLKLDLIEDCWSDAPAAPPDASKLVVAAFQRWRGWDLENISDTVLMRRIFGSEKAGDKTAANGALPLLGVFVLGELHLVLDPGPKENKIGIVDFTARTQQTDPGTLPSKNDDLCDGTIHVVSLYCKEAGANLNWELCELISDVARLYSPAQPSTNSAPAPAVHKKSTPEAAYAVHVVFEVDRGSFELETINLNAAAVCHGMKTSLLFRNSFDRSQFASIILNCDTVTSQLRSHTQIIGVFQLQQPSVYLSHELQELMDASLHSINTTASSHGLKLSIKQDPIVLLEIADLLLRDEVTQLYQLKARVSKSSPTVPAPAKPLKVADPLSSLTLNVALFLDHYTLSVPLLQSLTYKIHGSVARASCAAQFGARIVFDFDIKENFHETQIDVHSQPHRISLLEIPPTNGRVVSYLRGPETELMVWSSVELIQLDASAVYSLLSALNRPQISSAVHEAQEQVKVIQSHVSDIFGHEQSRHSLDPTPSASGDGSSLIYHVNLTLEGLHMSAITPLKSSMEPMSQVIFSLDKVYLQATNRDAFQNAIMKYPELHVNVKQIGLDIRRGVQGSMRSCGSITAGMTISASARQDENARDIWTFNFSSPDLNISMSSETMATAVGVLGYLTRKIKDLDASRELDYLRRLRQSRPRITIEGQEMGGDDDEDIIDSVLASLTYHFKLQNIQVFWNVANGNRLHSNDEEDLSLTISLIEFGTRSKKSARLTIEYFQLQMIPPGQDKTLRSLHSALLPEVIFNIAYVSTPAARRLAFQAVGQSLDLRLTSGFILPAAKLAESISLSVSNVQETYAAWGFTAFSTEDSAGPTSPIQSQSIFSKRRLENLLIDADFAGAVVHVSSKRTFGDTARATKPGRAPLAGKYGQFSENDSGSAAVLQSPGLAWKFEFADNGHDDPTLSGEVKIDASSNTLHPTVVPLVMDIVSSVKKVVSDTDKAPPKMKQEKTGEEENILTADPSAVLGRLKLNLGLRICRQEFSLSCQPIARVAATACFDGIYFTVNTVSSQDHGNFFAISGSFTNLQASVQHVYSRESTGSFEIENITLSFMNSKHVSGTSGVSAILKVSPTKLSINAKQVQDFLLFREIWYPRGQRQASSSPVAKLVAENSQGHLVQRYQQVAATAAFPWTATISIASLDVNVDLGQAIGRSIFEISDFWISSKKTSDWEQNLCLGFKKIGMDCTGRLSGFFALQDFRLRTSIQWPKREEALNETPLVQGSIGFNAFRLKAAFDYQGFLVADITSLEFLMYNVRESNVESGDRLVVILDGEAVQIFGTTTSTAQAVALYQAFTKLMQEKRDNFESSLREIEKFLRRKSSAARQVSQPRDLSETAQKTSEDDAVMKSPISLDTDVIVTLKALNLGIFPSTFSDHQVFKIEALDAYARFAASVEQGRIHSILKMKLGQLRIGLAGVRHIDTPKTLSEITVEEVVKRATGSRGGTILKVPQVSALMETWQTPESKMIDYIFKSAFEGKVEVGWNYSRISFIRGMLANHSKSLEQTWGKELPIAAVKITGVPAAEGEQRDGEQQKITAEVNVPQSKYNYVALEPPVIVTPQLRDMGEATPPLEWIGLHRERLPNLTHQIVIVSLLELAGEVEDAYSRILGSS